VRVQEYLDWFDEVVHPTEQMFLRVPDDKLGFRVTIDSFSVGQLLNHIPRSLAFNSKVVSGEELPLKSMREILISNRRHPSSTREEAIGLLREARNEFSSAVIGIGDERFHDGVLDTPQRGKIAAWRFCVFVVEHHIHHLMELHISLKMLGVAVNTKTLYVG